MIVLDSAGFIRQPPARPDTVPDAPTPAELDPEPVITDEEVYEAPQKTKLYRADDLLIDVYDMFSNTLRVLLIAGCVLIGIVDLVRNYYWRSLLFFAATGLLVYGYFRYGPIWLVAKYVQNGQTAKAERLLSSIKRPALLSAQSKAYYFFYRGLVEDCKNNLAEAENCFGQALDAGLRTTNDESIANLNLASIHYRQGRIDDARERLKQASELSHKPAIDGEIEKLKTEIN